MPSGEPTLSDARRRRRRRTLLACAALVVSSAGATVAWFVTREDVVCTLIGGWSSVDVKLTERQAAVPRVVVCVEGICETLGSEGLGFPGVPIRAEDEGPTEVDVLVIVDRPRAPAVIRTGRVRLQPFQPNGPGCGDPWWRATVVVDRDGVRRVG